VPNTPDIENAILTPDDPFDTIQQWLNDATLSEPNNPEAMVVATVDKTGLPNARMLLLKGIDPPDHTLRGLKFYTNLGSTKGAELAANPKATLLFHWKSLGRQIRIRGTVTPVSPEDADTYFATRSRDSRIGAWASDQSKPLQSRSALEQKFAQLTEKFHDTDVPRPDNWSGYRLTPIEIEFWKNGDNRLHDRQVYRRTSHDSSWTITRLNP